jgi:hypothetical protein
MGFVASAVGFGGFVGRFAVLGICDLGRRVTAVVTFLAASLGVWGLMSVGPSPVALFMNGVRGVIILARRRGFDYRPHATRRPDATVAMRRELRRVI